MINIDIRVIEYVQYGDEYHAMVQARELARQGGDDLAAFRAGTRAELRAMSARVRSTKAWRRGDGAGYVEDLRVAVSLLQDDMQLPRLSTTRFAYVHGLLRAICALPPTENSLVNLFVSCALNELASAGDAAIHDLDCHTTQERLPLRAIVRELDLFRHGSWGAQVRVVPPGQLGTLSAYGRLGWLAYDCRRFFLESGSGNSL